VTIAVLGTVLCPVDLSEHSQAALYHAAGFAHSPDARLVVLRVESRRSGEDDDAAKQELDEFVRATLPGFLGYRSSTELIVRPGDAAPTILAVAREFSADLIVMGTRGRGALTRALLGSTAAQIFRDTRVPVAVVPPTHPEVISLGETRAVFHFGLILVPIDLREAGAAQLAWAGRLSGGSERHLLLMTVVASAAERNLAMEQLNEIARAMQSAHGVKLLVREGAAIDEVEHVARHERAGLVVLGQSSDAPGKMAYELLRRTSALVLMVPSTSRT
jgi:nucleotide-binding universal stress UspA family protein